MHATIGSHECFAVMLSGAKHLEFEILRSPSVTSE